MRSRNTPFALVTKPVAGLRQLLDAVEGKLRSQVEREGCLDDGPRGGWNRTRNLIRVLEVVQAKLLAALFYNWKVTRKKEMLAEPEERFALRQRFGGRAGLEAWEGRAHASPLPLRCAQHLPRQGEGSPLSSSFPLTGKVAEPKARSVGVRPLFRLARVRHVHNNNAKPPRLHAAVEQRGLPRGAERVAYHDGGPASSLRSCGNLRRDYQIEVWPVELMWRRERRSRTSRRSSPKVSGKGRRRQAGGRDYHYHRKRRMARVRGSPFVRRPAR